jgi:hypothetical protein
VFPAGSNDAASNISRRAAVVTKLVNGFGLPDKPRFLRSRAAKADGTRDRPAAPNFFIGGPWLLAPQTTIDQYNNFLARVVAIGVRAMHVCSEATCVS